MSRVIITVTCDWDGLDYPIFGEHNPHGDPHFRFNRGMAALRRFEEKFAHKIPLTHFICPVYFTRNKALSEYYAQAVTELIASTRCEIGLHLHGWISLMRACGIAPQDPVVDLSLPDWGATENSRYGLAVPYQNDAGENCVDYGHGVPLGVYRKEEIIGLLQAGRDLLVANGIVAAHERCVSFRCGGWLSNDAVLSALQRVQPAFKFEASPVDAAFFAQGTGLLAQWLAALWGPRLQFEKSFLANRLFLSAYPEGIRVFDRAHEVTAAQPQRLQGLVLLPDTALLADYVSAGDMQAQVDRAVASAAQHKRDLYLSLGFHLESGGDPRWGKVFGHIERVFEALEYVEKKYQREENLIYFTMAEAGQHFLQNAQSATRV